MSGHYSEDFSAGEDGWWVGRCSCGLVFGVYPDADDACDALMDHAYEAGVADARASANSHSRPALDSQESDQ